LLEDFRLQGDGGRIDATAGPRKIDRYIERDTPIADDDDAVGKRDGFGDIVRDEQRREAMAEPQALQERMHITARHCV
jgi:hypothetical protein